MYSVDHPAVPEKFKSKVSPLHMTTAVPGLSYALLNDFPNLSGATAFTSALP